MKRMPACGLQDGLFWHGVKMEALHVPEKLPPPWSNGVLGVESEVADHSGRMRST